MTETPPHTYVPHPADADFWFQPDLANDPSLRPPTGPLLSGRLAVCADVGSTFTKAALIDLDTGKLLATGEHRTTVTSDVLHGLDAAIAQLPDAADALPLSVCSSAGGGLRLAVVGNEELVSAEAGHQVGLSAGARVVHVVAGALDKAGIDALRISRPDVILLVGGTDGGDAEVLLHNAERLAKAGPRVPVVVAGNADARPSVLAALGTRALAAENVLPRIGELNPKPARSAIRDVFLKHVIGGKRLSQGPRFASVVRGATPDVVLTAVELLADYLGGDLVVVDIGGATTDVYSVLSPAEDSPQPAAGTLWRSRTVEGDLGMRWSAPGVVRAAAAERLLHPGEEERLALAVKVRAEDPTFIPAGPAEQAVEARLASLAATIALRRHARGKDLRRVRLVVGSGGVLRHDEHAAEVVLRTVLADEAGGWTPPTSAVATIDREYVLAAAGLLAADHYQAALSLLRTLTNP